MLKSLFPTAHTKTFACYYLRTSSQWVAISAKQVTKADLRTVQAILAQLKRYSLEELERLSHARQLYVHKIGGVKAALHAAPYEAGLEVVTLATALGHLRRGYASALLRTFLNANPDADVALKVNVENTAAVSLYEHSGSTRQNDLTEVWWYLPL